MFDVILCLCIDVEIIYDLDDAGECESSNNYPEKLNCMSLLLLLSCSFKCGYSLVLLNLFCNVKPDAKENQYQYLTRYPGHKQKRFLTEICLRVNLFQIIDVKADDDHHSNGL
jgi:hypothetical protein